jgi:hypothetical protein
MGVLFMRLIVTSDLVLDIFGWLFLMSGSADIDSERR